MCCKFQIFKIPHFSEIFHFMRIMASLSGFFHFPSDAVITPFPALLDGLYCSSSTIRRLRCGPGCKHGWESRQVGRRRWRWRRNFMLQVATLVTVFFPATLHCQYPVSVILTVLYPHLLLLNGPFSIFGGTESTTYFFM